MGPIPILVIVVVDAGPVAQAPAEVPYLVELEISHGTEEPDFYAPGLPVEVSVDLPVSFRVSVFDATGEPLDVEDTTQLLEIHREGADLRFGSQTCSG